MGSEMLHLYWYVAESPVRLRTGITMFARHAPVRACRAYCGKYGIARVRDLGQKWVMCSKHCNTMYTSMKSLSLSLSLARALVGGGFASLPPPWVACRI